MTEPTRCADCQAAESAPRSDAFTAGCMSCSARALAAIGAHLESRDAKQMTVHYLSVLKQIFGEGWKDGAALVKVWAERIDKPRKSA